MLRHIIIAAGACLVVPVAAAEPGPDLTALRGFRIGTPCSHLEPAYDAMRRDGFDVPPVRFTCNYQAGRYRQDYLLRAEDGRQEFVELFYTADSTLWRVRVTLVWDNEFKLSPGITPAQAEASLRSRFGEPQYDSGGKTAELKTDAGGMHSHSFAWADPLSSLAIPTSFVDRINLMKSAKDLRGIVTEARLTWFDKSPKVTLVVDMTDRQQLPAAARAQRDIEQERAAEAARRDASMLRGL